MLGLPFRGLSVCLSVTFVHCAQTAEDIDTIYFTYDSPMSLPHRVKIWFTSVNPFLSKFFPKVAHPRLIWSSETHSMANCGRMVRGSAMVTMDGEPRKPLFRMVPSQTPYGVSPPLSPCLLPPNGGPKCTPEPTSRCVLPPSEYDRRYRQGSYVLCRMLGAMSPFAELLWPLL